MSDGATQNGETQAASTGAAAAVAVPAVAATAVPAAPVAAQAAAPAVAAVAAATAPAAAVVVPAAVAVAPAAAAQVDCKPVKKKVHLHDKKDGEEDHARAPGNDEDQNLSQPADGCVLPQTGQAAAPVQEGGAAPAVVVDEVGGGGLGSNSLLIGAGVLAAIGVGVLAASGGGDDDDDTPPAPVNGNPVATADTNAVNEGASVTGSVATNDTDPNGDTLTFALSGAAPAGLTFNSNGSYTFDANNAAYNSLAAGATQVVTIPYTVSDGKGGTASSTLTITVTGTNDNPVAGADAIGVNEGSSVVASVANNDSDPDTGDVRTYSLNGTAPAGLTFNSNGSYTFDASVAAYNGLAAGATQVLTVPYTVSDGKGGSATANLVITVTGTNDAPTARADAIAVNEGSSVVASVANNDSDPDTGDVLTYSLNNAAPAGLTFNSNGSYVFDANNAAYNGLAAGATQVVTVPYTVSDGKGGTSTANLVITITGTNDAPIARADAIAVNEDASIVASVANNDSDPEGGTLTYSLINPAPAGLTFNANGSYTFDASNPAYQNLTEGQVQNVQVNYRVTDAQGLTTDSTLTITVTGVAETVNLDTNTINPFDAGVTDFRFIDTDDIANSVVINNFGADDVITFDAPFTGAVTFANVNADNGTIANDLRISTTLNGQVSEIILTNVLSAADAAAGISTEAAAEAAVGANFDNFRTTAVSTPVATTTASLDVDNDANSLTARPFDASTDAFRFTDSATVESNAVISGLGNNDRIVFSGTTAAGVSYTSGALDADGIGNDLSISINNGGVVSLLVLKDAIVNTNVIVFDEATAELALGGIDYFQFA